VRTRLEPVVVSLCQEVAKVLEARPIRALTEQAARNQLVGCVLSSQVRHASAVQWTGALIAAGFLDDSWWYSQRSAEYGRRLSAFLSGRARLSRGLGAYRFPQARATQIAGARDSISAMPLLERLSIQVSTLQLRRSLASDIPGLGPKQTSMMLRNLGISLDLAVIDRYVLRFMQSVRLVGAETRLPTSFPEYERIENRLAEYARSLGYSLGCMDWAIWATMKAADEVAA